MKHAFALLLFLVSLPARAGVLLPQRGSSEVLIPAAGFIIGANGTFFRSDIRITNLRSVEQRVALYWLPQGQSGAGMEPIIIHLPELGKLSAEDFVGVVMRRSGLGAILARGILADGSIDPEARIDATSRIWSPAPDGNGTTSQSLPTLPARQIESFQLLILGQRREDRYRVNVGIVNLDETTRQTYRILVSGDTPTVVAELHEMTVEPFSMNQMSIPGAQQLNLEIHVEVQAQEGGGVGSRWTAYGSSVDNVTGDAWSSIGFDISPLTAP